MFSVVLVPILHLAPMLAPVKVVLDNTASTSHIYIVLESVNENQSKESDVRQAILPSAVLILHTLPSRHVCVPCTQVQVHV